MCKLLFRPYLLFWAFDAHFITSPFLIIFQHSKVQPFIVIFPWLIDFLLTAVLLIDTDFLNNSLGFKAITKA